MLRLTLAQMRRSVGRLTAAGLAIAIGTAFVAATLLATGVMTRMTYDAVASSYARADLVVADGWSTDEQVAVVATAPGVAAATGVFETYLQLHAGVDVAFLPGVPVAPSPALQAQTLVDGALPAAGELALPAPTARRLGVAIGDTVTVTFGHWHAPEPAEAGDAPVDPDGEVAGSDEAGEWVETHEELRVAGLLEDDAGAFAAAGGAAIIDGDDARRWHALQSDGEPVRHRVVLVALDEGADLEVVRGRLVDDLARTPDGAEMAVRTRDEQARHLAAEISGDTGMLTAGVLGFAAIAMIVASFVIANTFSVLVAQRTRTLALLRCVGATRRQLRRSVQVEALLLGVVGSVTGIVAGTGLAQGALVVLRRLVPEVPLPAVVALRPAVVLVPLTVGVLVTVVAATAPARAAGRVAPLAAMRPAEPPTLRGRTSQLRLVATLLLVVSGVGLLGVGMLASTFVSTLLGLGLGILGGLLSFTGVLIGAVLWIPPLVGGAGAVLTRLGGPASRLAAANTVRNPRRTAATSSALLIGVTLVTMMSTGAASARQSLETTLAAHYPVDVTVTAVPTLGADGQVLGSFDPATVATVADVGGVATVVDLAGVGLSIHADDAEHHAQGYAVTADDAATVLRDPRQVAGLADDTLVVPELLTRWTGLEHGQHVSVRAVDLTGAPLDGPSAELQVVVTALPDTDVLLTPATLARLAPEAPTTRLWVGLADDAAVADTITSIRSVLSEQVVAVSSPAAQRAMYEQVIDTLLAIVLGLLGVAVVIALVGVANTLSLSVIERRRESATLRAIGLTRRQLRQTLAVEGVLIAGSGGVLGVVLGTLYGWAGSHTVLGSLVDGVTLAVAWREVALVVAVALVAGLLASVLPGRRAALTSPVEALATD